MHLFLLHPVYETTSLSFILVCTKSNKIFIIPRLSVSYRNGLLFNIWRLLNSEHALINIIMTFELIVPEILIFKWKESGSEIPILQRNLHNK
jgi:hypothetical protein